VLQACSGRSYRNPWNNEEYGEYMAWNGSGTFSPSASYYPEVNGTVIDAVRYNGLMLDLAAGINNALAKDGQNTATGNLKMGGYKLTGLGAGTQAGDAVRWEQVQQAGTSAITVTGATVDLANVLSQHLVLTPGGGSVTSFGVAPAGRSYFVTTHPSTATPGTTILEGASIILPLGADVPGFSRRIDITPNRSFRLTSLGSGVWRITDLVIEAYRQHYSRKRPPTVTGAGTGATVTGNAYAFTVVIGTGLGGTSNLIETVSWPDGQPQAVDAGTGFYIVQTNDVDNLAYPEVLGSGEYAATVTGSLFPGTKLFWKWAG
jgi:hypothetical protein